MKKRLLSCFLVLALLGGLCAAPVSAKSISSARADHLFFYVMDGESRSVLLKVIPLSALKELAHGQPDGSNYYISTTDNYPTTQYCEGRGFTLEELVRYVKSVTTVKGAATVDFSGGDTMHFMATDSYGNYSRNWTYDELYGVKRYYFEGLYDTAAGWKPGWEVAGEDNSKFGLSLEEYNESYAAVDPYYADKRAVFDAGAETTVILATESYSGRTTTQTLNSSTEPGIASYLQANGGLAAGSLREALTDAYALRLSLPMTEADLMAAHRTAYDNFKWIYNMRLDMEGGPAISSLGRVAEPVPSFRLSGNTLTVSFSCATPGASIYYGDDGAPQTLYTGPITVDVTGRSLSANPVTLYATAVKEGYDDAGVLLYKYPGMAPAFQTVYSGMTDSPLAFAAAAGVPASEWSAWTGAMNFITLKAPSVGGYLTVDKAKYTIDDAAKTITFDRSLFTETGSYSFVFHATKYADKNLSVTMKKAAPALRVSERSVYGQPVTVYFDEAAYNSGLSVYVTPEGGKRTLISASYLDRTQAGQVVIKADYFTVPSTIMPAPDVYTLELANNSFSPASQTVTVALTDGFTDVLPGVWYYDYVTALAGVGVMTGVGNHQFQPEGTLTWGQAMKLLLLAAGYEEQAPVGAHWASGYMARAAADGLIDPSVDPDAVLSRLAFCQVAAKVLKLSAALTVSPFTDTDDPGVLALYERGIINGVGNGAFAPDATLTRAEISKIIWCIMDLEGKLK